MGILQTANEIFEQCGMKPLKFPEVKISKVKYQKTLVSECCGAEMQPEDSRCPDCRDGAVGEI